MSGKNQASQGEEQEDLLEQIFTQGMEKLQTPAQAKAPPRDEPPDPGPEESRDAAFPAKRKNGSPNLCFYLMILFGAAFLVTLLACFVQRRNNENTIDSMNLSREELLDEIRELEKPSQVLSVGGRQLDVRLPRTGRRICPVC